MASTKDPKRDSDTEPDTSPETPSSKSPSTPDASPDAPKPDAPKPPPEPPKAVSKTEALRTPAEWAAAKGLVRHANPKLPQSSDVPHFLHVVADRIHGWSVDAHHNQGDKAFRLSEVDYVAAIKAARAYPTSSPHMAAVAPTAMERAKAHKPRAKRDKAAARREGAKIVRGREAWQHAEKLAASERVKRERAARREARKGRDLYLAGAK